ncbi:DMT family transporter [Ureibacillus sp. FSL K6-8385]|uniref:EamA family transporter n=1 Tax=Ureibacillus terrenus TaxID=118246 RepID=A0A540V5B2_9BACL|nr:DMT family transporter [Ureibacillus terrenus]MED3661141.1 DMT family transporter [Ureibacillus terrenus]MED3764381.1 DMT family transporter [Ureibacillus terrenus]TQE91944.1 EamA family transporter [Ureibacillus terrenus]
MKHLKGISFIVLGAMLWGTTGPLTEWVLKTTGMTVGFLLTLRLLAAGISILAFLQMTKKPIFDLWKTKYWSRQIVVYSILGMLGLQYSFTTTIHVSNAVFATLLQFLGPIFIVAYTSLKVRMWPPGYQVLGIIGTLLGLFLLLTNARFEGLLVGGEALFWGFILGITFAIYTLYPARLMAEWGVLLVVGWGMLVGGIVLGIATFIWKSKEWLLLLDFKIFLIMAAIIFFSTLAFVLFLSSMKYISPVLTSVLSTMEPLTTMVISWMVFSTSFGFWQIIGIVLMLTSVTWISVASEKAENTIKGK